MGDGLSASYGYLRKHPNPNILHKNRQGMKCDLVIGKAGRLQPHGTVECPNQPIMRFWTCIVSEYAQNSLLREIQLRNESPNDIYTTKTHAGRVRLMSRYSSN